MTIEEIMNCGPTDVYALAVCVECEGKDHWFILNDWKISIKKCIGSYKNSASFRKLEDFKEVRFLKRSFNTTTVDITPANVASHF